MINFFLLVINIIMANSNSDSNNILRTILIVLIVVGIAYLIYYLYNQNTMVNNVNTENKKEVKVNVPQQLKEHYENPINIKPKQ